MRFTKMKNLIFGSALLLSADVSADNESAFSAAEEGDHAATLYELRLLAAQGDANVQYNLAVLYDQGTEAPQDYAEAVEWYTKAAEQGYAAARRSPIRRSSSAK